MPYHWGAEQLISRPALSDPSGTVDDMAQVSERQILEFESDFFAHAGEKESAIRDELGITPAHYFQHLKEIVLDPAPHLALEYRMLINRTVRKMGWDEDGQRTA
jgi:Protein of unknown function (DUF3263)